MTHSHSPVYVGHTLESKKSGPSHFYLPHWELHPPLGTNLARPSPVTNFLQSVFLQVTLQEPVIKHPEKYDRTKPTRLNKLNNVEWDVEIGTNETKELTLKYTVEHPVTEEVDTSIVHISAGSAQTSSEA